jgi:hypothetical protein
MQPAIQMIDQKGQMSIVNNNQSQYIDDGIEAPK